MEASGTSGRSSLHARRAPFPLCQRSVLVMPSPLSTQGGFGNNLLAFVFIPVLYSTHRLKVVGKDGHWLGSSAGVGEAVVCFFLLALGLLLLVSSSMSTFRCLSEQQ